jgi:hypothetical protein
MWREFLNGAWLLLPILALTVFRAVTMTLDRRLQDVRKDFDEQQLPVPLTPEQEWDAEMALHLQKKRATVHADPDPTVAVRLAELERAVRVLSRENHKLRALARARAASARE